jgi:hypothetical protein
MKQVFTILIAIFLLGAFVVPAAASTVSSGTIPTFSIVSVDADKTVTIKTNNFPANDTFTVTMGPYGTKGIGGVVIGSTNSGKGGTFTVTYNIPSSLAGSYRIAIRLQSPSSGYFAYNWFYNNTSSGTTPPSDGYTGFPYFFIESVTKDDTVTIKAHNFPANDNFIVKMGAYGTKGVGGVVVTTTGSGTGGIFTATYDIPPSLAGSYRIAIRLESSTSGYFAYNWFYNNTTTVTPSPAPPPPDSGYSGFPTFVITSVVKDQRVTINTHNFPANDKFTVTMGAYGTQGVGGIVVGTTESGNGGSFSVSYDIPASLAGSYRIAIRLQSPTSGYFAYNWFYNNSTP